MSTKFDNATSFRKSLEARLKATAMVHGEDLQRLRRKVAFDRFLARVCVNNGRDFVLKRGYAMELRLAKARATKDIDLTCLSRYPDRWGHANELILTELKSLVRSDLGECSIWWSAISCLGQST